MSPSNPELQSITAKLPEYLASLLTLKEVLIANAVMIGEIPAPTGEESKRMQFMIDRFTEDGLHSISHDEAGNAMALLPGKKGEKTILVMAHADTLVPKGTEHSLRVDQDRITGPGIADNGIGLATVVSLPIILDKLGIELDDNLLLMGVAQSLGEGDLAGLRFFLENNPLPIRAALCLEGHRLGRLTYNSLGTLRGEINAHIPESTDTSLPYATGAVDHLAKVATKIREIQYPQSPKTSVILGSLHSGAAFNRIARKGKLKFEINSEDFAQVEIIKDQIQKIVDDTQYTTHAQLSLNIIGRRNPGGLSENHPLVQTQLDILNAHQIEPIPVPSTGDLSALAENQLPALTLGLSYGENLQELNESIHIKPLFSGISQLIALLQAIDRNLCNE